VAHAFAHADEAGRALLLKRLGDPSLDADGVAELQQVLDESGARKSVEEMIDEGYERAMLALDEADITDEGRTALVALADAAIRRDY
jgi:geranylgeranyl diphosphate synthase type I